MTLIYGIEGKERRKKIKLFWLKWKTEIIQPPIWPPNKKSTRKYLIYRWTLEKTEVPGGIEPPSTVLQTAT
jgi:hypothetical protein